MSMSKMNGFVVMATTLCTQAAFTAFLPIMAQAQSPPTLTYSIGIEGLTCERCSASAQKELAAVPGVVKASVDYKAGHAWVTVQAPRQPVGTEKPRRIGAELAEVVRRAGANHGDGFQPTVNYVLTVKGMTCEDCSQHVTTALTKVPGVAAASVDYKGGYAVVVPSAKAGPNPQRLVSAVETAGYKAVVHTGP
uniref:HMA domain-containing protein n=1 Tax=Schlesneria paludicola TaxID=360056 RepID=A0A7C2JZ61_9PLAN